MLFISENQHNTLYYMVNGLNCYCIWIFMKVGEHSWIFIKVGEYWCKLKNMLLVYSSRAIEWYMYQIAMKAEFSLKLMNTFENENQMWYYKCTL